LNTAEGNGRRQRQTRAKFLDDARGSATECAACLDALVAKKLCSVEEVTEGKELLLRVVSMLTKLVDRFDSYSSSSSSSSSVREDMNEDEVIEDEDEDVKKNEGERNKP
jgi:hypothetical protein